MLERLVEEVEKVMETGRSTNGTNGGGGIKSEEGKMERWREMVIRTLYLGGGVRAGGVEESVGFARRASGWAK